MEKAGFEQSKVNLPLWLLAEVSYRCPLHCVYCYNPIDYASYGEEMSTEDWLRVLRQGRELGATQLGFSGGEPLMRSDLEILVAEARRLGYYSNLITSGVGLDERRIAAFKEGGLDHIQVSFQDSTREMNDFLSSTRTFDLKQKVARLVKKYDYPMVLNVVLHKLNIDHVMASSALPIVFPAVQLGRHWHGDGGVRLSAPLSPAHNAACQLRPHPGDIGEE